MTPTPQPTPLEDEMAETTTEAARVHETRTAIKKQNTHRIPPAGSGVNHEIVAQLVAVLRPFATPAVWGSPASSGDTPRWDLTVYGDDPLGQARDAIRLAEAVMSDDWQRPRPREDASHDDLEALHRLISQLQERSRDDTRHQRLLELDWQVSAYIVAIACGGRVPRQVVASMQRRLAGLSAAVGRE